MYEQGGLTDDPELAGWIMDNIRLAKPGHYELELEWNDDMQRARVDHILCRLYGREAVRWSGRSVDIVTDRTEGENIKLLEEIITSEPLDSESENPYMG